MIEIALAIGIMIYSSEIEQCVCMKHCDVSHKNPGLVLVTLRGGVKIPQPRPLFTATFQGLSTVRGPDP